MLDTGEERVAMFDNIDDIKRANRKAGQHWFDPDWMRFFRSRVLAEVIGGRFFISSEKYVTYSPEYREKPRRYTIREANPDGTITTVGDFQAYASAAQARRAAKRLAEDGAER